MIRLMKKFKEIAPYIWGGIPHDTEWALNTQVFKQYCIKHNIKEFL